LAHGESLACAGILHLEDDAGFCPRNSEVNSNVRVLSDDLIGEAKAA